MVAFEVFVNKVKVCTAGIEDFDAIIGELVARVEQDSPSGVPKMDFHLSATDGETAYNWVQYELQVGSRVEIRVVDTSKTDKPKALKCSGGSCAT